MISLEKHECPQVLTDNALNWRTELCGVINAGQIPTNAQKNRYNHPDVKAVLIDETSGKCVYCESKIRHIDDGDIEHISPKSIFPELSFEWDNLTLACTICNRNKGNYTTETGPIGELINPYNDNPSEHFLFHKEILTPAPESLRGYKTDEIVNLNRGELIEKRREKLQEVHDYVTAYAQATDEYRPIVLRQIKKYCLGSDKEYSAFVKVYINEMIGRETLPEDIYG